MSDKKYVGAIAAAKIVTLIKAALGKKLDKSGGTITGSLEINGDVHAGRAVQSDLLLSAPSVAVHNGAGALVGINCSGDNAAGISSLGSDGKSRYSRFAVGTPTGDNDAATKAYVDGHAATDAVLYTPQTLTDAQKKQARANIDADIDFMITATLTSGGAATLDKTFAQVREAITGGKAVFMQIVDPKGSSTIRASLVRDTPTNLMFSAADRNGFYSVLNVVSVNSDDSCTVSHETMPVLDSKLALPQLSMASTPDEDMEIATKKYVDDHPAKDAVLYTAQTLTFEQKQRARNNIEALPVLGATTGGTVSMCPDFHVADSNAAVHFVPSKVSDDDYTLTLDCGPENWPVRVAGIRTPTDAQANYAANVAYVKAKISEVAASGGVDVDNALSATSTNPVQNKVVKAALDKKAGTAAATTSANGLMSAVDKKKLDGIASGATKITIDSAMSGSSNNPVANHVVKQYVDDKVAAAGSNITVDAELSATSTNPVQNKAVKSAIDGKADKTALNAKMDKSGGTFTGNVHGKYFCGTWLQSTEASDLGRTPGKIAVLDGSGWVYYRTPAELFGDLGIANAIKSYVDTAIVAAINSAY